MDPMILYITYYKTLFIQFINQKYTPTDIEQVQSRPTAGTKSNVRQNRPSGRPSNNESDDIKNPTREHNNT